MVDLIPGARGVHELCMLAGKYDPAHHPLRAVVQWKRDGLRCLFIDGKLYSREGSEMECAGHALGELFELQEAMGKRMFFDCEFVIGDTFEPANTAFKRRQPGEGLLYLFDAVPFDQWANCGRTAPLSARLSAMQEVSRPFRHLVIEHDIGNGAATRDDVQDIFADVTSQGGEGVIVKAGDSPYMRGRSRMWQKLKIAQRTTSGKLRHPAMKGL